MEIENKFNLEIKDEMLVVTQTITKTMAVEESMVEFKKLEQEEMQVKQQKGQLEEDITSKKSELDLVKLKENVAIIEALKKAWEDKTKPLVESLGKDLFAKIRAKKKELAYNYDKDAKNRLVLRAQILGEVAEEMNLDMQSPLVLEARNKFEEL